MLSRTPSTLTMSLIRVVEAIASAIGASTSDRAPRPQDTRRSIFARDIEKQGFAITSSDHCAQGALWGEGTPRLDECEIRASWESEVPCGFGSALPRAGFAGWA